MAKDTRTRAWTAIVYPESAPDNWRAFLDDQHLEWVESPLHEFDVNPTGELKKPHWHIMITFEGPKSYDQVVAILEPLHCAAPQRCHNQKSLVRYMCHLDNPDKFQYDISQIVAHGGVDVRDLLKPSSAERYTLIAEMCDFIAESNITEFFALMDYARIEKFDTWFPLLCDSSAYVVNQYIKSNRERCQKEITSG